MSFDRDGEHGPEAFLNDVDVRAFPDGHFLEHEKNLSRSRLLRRAGIFCRDACRFAANVIFSTRSGFDKSLAEIARGEDAAVFSIPWARAAAVMGESLRIWAPGEMLGKMLVEWAIDRDGAVWNILEYFVGSGDWRLMAHDFSCYDSFKDMRAILEFGGDFRQSDQYRRRLEQLGRGELSIAVNTVPIDGVELLDAYFTRYLRLLNSIREHGLLPHGKVGKSRRFDPRSKLGQTWFDRDISVAIGPGGELHRLQRANHRSAAAMLLGLPAVPAEVGLIHRDWLRATLEKYPGKRPADALAAGIEALSARRR